MVAEHSPGECRVEIDLEAIRHNLRTIASAAHPAQVMTVVKADGYGHGMIPVARAAVEAGSAWLGTAHIQEALALREAGIQVPILAWLHTPATDFEAAIVAGIDIGVSSWELEHVIAAARAQQCPARVHLKIDTGLGRNGSTAERWDALLDEAVEYQDQGLLRVVGIFTHLAVADEPSRDETDQQLQRFREAVAMAEDAGVDPEVRHAANTPAIFSRPDSHFDLVRAGVAVYGLSPFPGQTSQDLGLIPAMTFKTIVANCKDVPTGQGVSYGLEYRTAQPSTLALIPVGYSDGVPRSASGAPVRIGDEVFSVSGRIAMDQLVVDLGPGHVVAEGCSLLGQEVTLFGADPSVDLWAAAAGTINYEIVTRVASRVPRVYLNETPVIPAFADVAPGATGEPS
ncbi:alanine racemase [Acaricomes phytoseiuli]|uniref:alanine racemase n=1 Tax=Acaricomes phytoseiuli TaxID=291968 RepID=UPI002223A157|nr:alanine racemase [Acaricomes phytoseiuli]MCW1250117.1 alanine racemase [Acaricomes phytoseiuli]